MSRSLPVNTEPPRPAQRVGPSATLLNLKFMQKKEEKKILKNLEAKQAEELKAAQWELRPSDDLVDRLLASFAPTTPGRKPALRPQIEETQENQTKTEAFVAGRRSFGSFNPKLDGVISSARGASRASVAADVVKARDLALGVDEKTMAETFSKNRENESKSKHSQSLSNNLSSSSSSSSKRPTPSGSFSSSAAPPEKKAKSPHPVLSLKEQAKLDELERKKQKKALKKSMKTV